MFKNFFTLIFAFIIFNAAKAQSLPGDNEITIGFGVLPSIQVFKGTEFYLTWGVFTTYVNTYVSGEYFVKYKYDISSRLSISLYGGREQESGDWYNIEKNNSSRPSDWETFKIGTFNRTSWTIAPEANLYYYNSKYCRIYNTLGVSQEIISETDNNNSNGNNSLMKNNSTYLSMYFSPFGISFGDRFSGNFEFGLGYKGIFNCGMSYKFIESKKGLPPIGWW